MRLASGYTDDIKVAPNFARLDGLVQIASKSLRDLHWCLVFVTKFMYTCINWLFKVLAHRYEFFFAQMNFFYHTAFLPQIASSSISEVTHMQGFNILN